jgi:hypothetical protein
MNFQSFKVSDIVYNGNNLLYNGKRVILKTPVMCSRFGLEESYGKYYLKLEFTKSRKELNMIKFLDLIKAIEKHTITHLDIDTNDYKSSIRFNGTFEPLLTTRIQVIKNKPIINTSSNTDTNYLSTIYDIQPKSMMQCELEFSKIWKSNGQYGCIIYVRKIIFM